MEFNIYTSLNPSSYEEGTINSFVKLYSLNRGGVEMGNFTLLDE
jgi:hypothetical protein